MKILFHRIQLYPGSPTEYLGDSVLLGLKKLPDVEVVDIPRLDILYKDYASFAQNKKLFSLYGKLEDNVNRNTTQFFQPEKIITSLHHSTDGNEGVILRELSLLKKKYNVKNKDISVLDGQDSPQIYREVAKNYTYFKREFNSSVRNNSVRPVGFSVPQSLYVKDVPGKTKAVATLIPACATYPKHYDTYKFQTEEEYYQDYRDSWFGITTKKGGWDCLRHYEIIANGCLPYFLNLEDMHSLNCIGLDLATLQAVTKLDGLDIVSYGPAKHHGDLVKPGLRVDMDKFDTSKAKDLINELLSSTWSSERMAQWVLE